MSNLNTTAFALPSGYLEKSEEHMSNFNVNSSQSSLWQIRSSLQGPVAILWDIENCPVPSDMRPEDVAVNIRMALRAHPMIDGAVTMFSAYGDFNAFPRRVREGCQRTGVKLVDVPNGRKDAADKAILVDMFLFALDHRPPSSIMLISGDVDFAPALHILGQRGYTVILVIPSRVGVSSALINAGRFLWDWPSVAHGEGFVPQAKTSIPRADITGCLMGYPIKESIDCLNEEQEEEAIVYRGISKSYYNTHELISESVSERNTSSVSLPYNPMTSRSQTFPSGLHEVSAGTLVSGDQNDKTWVQPGDLDGLKGQLVKLLDLSGGCLLLTRIPVEYQKTYGRPLCMSEYGATKLVRLLKKMADSMTVEGNGQRKFVYLCNSKSGPHVPPLVLPKGDKKGKGVPEDKLDVIAGVGSSDEFLDYERVVVEERSDDTRRGQNQILDQSLDQFKYELKEILVSYSCKIFLSCFQAIYQQRYKRPLDYPSYGVVDLDELLAQVRDIVVLQEEPTSKRKFLVAVDG
ncbi:putative endonuclease or glycosyl hydrolase [Forsythia ovata]|uniref:Endonuclease or glycosyl hydrolase n=1 Tax=Forsythia ovata TaxID=205694 RepID=A0ABD1VJH1_9LAMI